MSSLNKVMLIARLGRDPEVRYTAAGKAVANVSAATSRKWNDKATGNQTEETEWHRLVAYDKLAEIMGGHLKKGSLAYFEGRLKTRKWQNKEGADQYTTEIVVDQMQMLGGREESAEAAPKRAPAPAAAPGANTYAAAKAGQPSPSATPSLTDMDDDIPF